MGLLGVVGLVVGVDGAVVMVGFVCVGGLGSFFNVPVTVMWCS